MDVRLVWRGRPLRDTPPQAADLHGRHWSNHLLDGRIIGPPVRPELRARRAHGLKGYDRSRAAGSWARSPGVRQGSSTRGVARVKQDPPAHPLPGHQEGSREAGSRGALGCNHHGKVVLSRPRTPRARQDRTYPPCGSRPSRRRWRRGRRTSCAVKTMVSRVVDQVPPCGDTRRSNGSRFLFCF
jgi:hypothetical protein